jgi:hypothetical protein
MEPAPSATRTPDDRAGRPGPYTTAPRLPAYTGSRELGRGRSGVVYYGRDEDGRELACKVFDSRSVTKLVQTIFLGSPNPYVWNEDAVRCALLRRSIATALCRSWFGERLTVADALGYGWNEEQRAFELRTRFTPARPLPLHHPLRTRGTGLIRGLTREVMRPLQQHLVDAGLDGLVWQAGKGNPVALNNFLHERVDGEDRWVWIDLESGVPALAALDPRALFGFYVPRSFRFGRPLFDDVDVDRLAAYLEEHAQELSGTLGAEALERLRDEAAELGRLQARWKSLRRHVRGIGYRHARGNITDDEAAWYRTRPVRWYAREGRRAVRGALRRLGALPGWVGRQLDRIPWRRLPRSVGRFLISQTFRERLARSFVAHRIRAWETRGQLATPDARHLKSHLDSEESSAYLTDFGVHVAIKPFVKSIEYWVLPVLGGMGVVSGTTVAIGLLAGGAIARSLYTGGRLIQSVRRGRERPWVALGVGVIPVVGNFAYPIQILWSSTKREDDLARFILYDGFARVGRNVPIWGGKDTLTEHVFNRLPDGLANLRRA